MIKKQYLRFRTSLLWNNPVKLNISINTTPKRKQNYIHIYFRTLGNMDIEVYSSKEKAAIKVDGKMVSNYR